MLNGNINSVGKIADTSGDKINFDNGILVIDETANRVGIGTLSPARRLEVNQGQEIVSTKITGNKASGHLIDVDHANSGVDSYNGFRFLDEGDNSRGVSLTHIGASSGRGKLQVGPSADGTGSILSVDGDNSRVGVGTLSPGTKLHLEQGDFRINNASNGHQVIQFAEAGTVKSKVGYNNSNDSFIISTLDASGNLDTRLNIFSATDTSTVQITNAGQSILSINNTATNGDQFRIISKVNGSTANLLFRDESNTTDIMTLTEDGNVGIATTTPEYKLKVNGAVGYKIPSTVTSVSSNLSVSDTSVIKLDADGGNITIDGLNGGRLGQILHLIKITSNNTVTIKHNNSSGEQKIGTVDDSDYVLSNKEGCTLVCIAASSDTVGNWRIVDK